MKSWRSILSSVVISGVLSGPSLCAQATHAPTTSGSQEPCWKQIGISQQALQQHRQIAEQMHNQVEQVCANSSLTAQQKQQKIRQIREQAHAQMDKLVSPSQMSALKECRAKRGQPETNTPQGASPCGEMPMNKNHMGQTGGGARN
jgi:cysteinyl-tRNA synthetase